MWSKCGRSRNSARGNTFRPQPVSGVASPSSRRAHRVGDAAADAASRRCRGACTRWPATSSRRRPPPPRPRRHRRRDVGRVVLPIAVERGDPGAARRAHAADDRGGLAAARPVPQWRSGAPRGRRRRRRAQRRRGRVGGAVVDIDDLVRHAGQRGAISATSGAMFGASFRTGTTTEQRGDRRPTRRRGRRRRRRGRRVEVGRACGGRG